MTTLPPTPAPAALSSDVTVPAEDIINALGARLGAEAARAETLQAQSNAFAQELQVRNGQLADARALLNEVHQQLARAQARADDDDDGTVGGAPADAGAPPAS